MRLTLNPRLSRIVRALPQGGPLAWLEIGLLAGLAIQLARLVWAVATPVGPLGDWRPVQPAAMSVAARDALLSRFDPFYRGSDSAGPAVVTSLSLKLFGVRLNEASGQGSAIIATPDGVQSSVGVGDEIVAGVRLKAVAIDHVVIDRGGVAETLYLDQSQPAPVADPAAGGSAPASAPSPVVGTMPAYNAPPAPVLPAPADLRSQFDVSPRISGGRINGLTVSPRGDGSVFRSAGLKDGDVIVRVDGRGVTSILDAQALQARLRPGTQVSLAVERAGQVVPLTVTLPGQ